MCRINDLRKRYIVRPIYIHSPEESEVLCYFTKVRCRCVLFTIHGTSEHGPCEHLSLVAFVYRPIPILAASPTGPDFLPRYAKAMMQAVSAVNGIGNTKNGAGPYAISSSVPTSIPTYGLWIAITIKPRTAIGQIWVPASRQSTAMKSADFSTVRSLIPLVRARSVPDFQIRQHPYI